MTDETDAGQPGQAGEPSDEGRGLPLGGLLVCQFFGAFNDNALKVFVTFLAIGEVARRLGAVGPAFEAASQTRATTAFIALTLPLVLVSLPAAALADRVSKRTLMVATKGFEVLLMGAVTVALATFPGDAFLPLAVLALMGAQSAVFSPAKYGILPEIVPHRALSRANGLLETWTMLAIIAGTASGGLLLEATAGRPWLVGALLTVFALVGFGASWRIPRVAAASPEGTGVAGSLQGAWSAVQADRVLRLAILGSVYLWAVASLLGQDVLVYARATLGLSESLAGLPLAVLGVGIALGCLLAVRLSGGKVEYGLIPLGAVGMALVTAVLAWWAPGLQGTLALMGLLGIAGGLVLVPIQALIQWRAPAGRRGAVIALANVFVYAGILVGSLGAESFSRVGMSPRGILAAAAVTIALGTLWALRELPDAFLRLVLVLLTHSVYRLRIVGRQRVPEEGPVLLVPNHVSFIDGFLLLASLDRPIRFVVDATYFHYPLLEPFMRSLGAIPISAGSGPKELLRSLRRVGEALDEGEVVCIFPEGQITRTGMLLPFRRGYERVLKGREVPVVPVHLDRLWGSLFSRSGGRFVAKVPRRIPYPVTVSFGEALEPETPIHEVRAAVRELDATAWKMREERARPLHATFVRKSRLRPWRLCMADGSRARVSRLRVLAGAVGLARALRERWEGQERVGVLLPPSVGGALVNLAAALAGRSSVNLNYTAGRAAMSSAVRQAGLETVVTSGLFVATAELELPEAVEPIWIEEVAGGIGRGARLAALALALLAPVRLLERVCGARRRVTPGDVATVIFSSGSTGEPKGVELTHFNVDSNVEAAAQVIQSSRHDRILGILPFFHSFGYMATLWLAVNNGMGVVYHPNPLDAAGVGEMVQRYRCTILIGTPTFLQLYTRRCTPAQFGSLRLVIAGAEKLGEPLARAFEDHFGLPVFEGYGATECAPAVALNAPDFRAPGFYQPGNRRGTVGQPLPGVAVRIVDPDTFAPLPPGEEGMILVDGPNVMAGYLGQDELTADVMRDGWYVTGDIGKLDEDGFLSITDRLARFSKIGGEMVPHGVVEEALHEAAEAEDRIFAVTSIDDDRRGERLAVVHTLEPEVVPGLLERLSGAGLPNLYIPRRDHFIRVDELPLLGSGKTDLRAVQEIARNHLA